MHSNRALAVVLLLVVAGALALWLSGSSLLEPAAPVPGATAGVGGGNPERDAGAAVKSDAALAAAAAGAATERIAAPADAGFDAGKPAVRGQVVSADGRPIAGARVIAAPGLAFSNADGQLDFDSFDVGDFEDADGLDPMAMMATAARQLAERVEVTTDGEGRFRIQPQGTTRGVGLRVLARGHAILDRRVQRPAERDVDVGVLTLQRGGVVSGRVLDPAGHAIAGARVRRVPEMEARLMGGLDFEMPAAMNVEEQRDGETSRTDDQGRFELLHLAAGSFELRARHDDHPPARQSGLELLAGAELRDVLITMQRGAEIRGRVVGLPEGHKGLQVAAAKKPRADSDPTGMMNMFGDMSEFLAEAGMPVGERSVDVAPDGQFVLHGLAVETYRVWVAQAGSGFAGSTVCSARVEVVAGAHAVELRYEPGVSVTFTVVDATTGAPIERLWVQDRLRGGGGFADMMAMAPKQPRSNVYPGGKVVVANLRPKPKQTVTLTVDAVGYRTWERSDLEPHKTGALDLGEIRLEQAPVVHVTVLAADTDRPVAGATVRIATPGPSGGNPFARLANLSTTGAGPASGKTGRDGRCTLNALLGEPAVIDVDSSQFAPFVSDAMTFAASGVTDFTARLHVGGAVAVTVLGPDEKPVKDALVEHKAPGGETAQRKTDAGGAVHFERLAPGSHGFRLGEDSGPMGMFVQLRGAEDGPEVEWQSIEVTDRVQMTLQLQKRPSANLTGMVRENGAPLAGARVMFVANTVGEEEAAQQQMMGEMMGAMAGGDRLATRTDDRGGYTLRELPEGSHRLRITHRGRAMPASVEVVLQNGDNTFDVELDMTTLRGVVRDPDGQPVDGARVKVARKAVDGEGGDIAAMVEGMMPGLGGDGSGTSKTDAVGAFELRGVEPGTPLLVTATAKGFAAATAETTVANGAATSALELRLGPAGRIKITMQTDAPFVPVRAHFVGTGGEGVPPVMKMLSKGRGTLDGLRPGTWEIQCESMDGGEESSRKRTVEVKAGQTVTVEFGP